MSFLSVIDYSIVIAAAHFSKRQGLRSPHMGIHGKTIEAIDTGRLKNGTPSQMGIFDRVVSNVHCHSRQQGRTPLPACLWFRLLDHSLFRHHHVTYS
jgi:hypothetical protein